MPVGPEQSALTGLDAAVAGVNSSRTALLETAGAVPAAATALDAADEASATGQPELAAAARRTARPAVAAASEALDRTAPQAERYRAALEQLERAAASLEPAQRDVLGAVAEAGRAEAAALGAFGRIAQQAWPAYAALDEVQATWLDRASAGWYRSDSEAAAAYVVLRRPAGAALQPARRALQAADAERRPATERVRRALREADAALEAWRRPVG